MNEIIRTMINQFCVTLNRLSAMTGAKNFVYDNNKNALYFDFKLCKKANKCTLQYNEGMDLYTMTFNKYNSRTADFKEIKKYEGLFCDDLKRIFEEFTGLYISL